MNFSAVFLGAAGPSALVALTLFILFAIATLIWLRFRVGQVRFLAGGPALWAANALWEWSRLGKEYDLKFDIYLTYPLLYFCTLMFVFSWGVTVLSALLERGELGLLAASGELDARRTKFIAGVGAGSAAIAVFPWLLSLTGVISTLSAMIGGIFGIVVLILGFLTLTYVLLGRSEAGTLSLKQQVEAEEAKVNDHLIDLTLRVQKLEELAVEMFHTISPEANKVFHEVKRYHSALTNRMNAVRELVERGEDVDLVVAKELLTHDLDLRDDFVGGLVTSDQRSRQVSPSEWADRSNQATEALDSILRDLQAVHRQRSDEGG